MPVALVLVAARLERAALPPTAPPKVMSPLPAVSVRVCVPAELSSTVLVKSMAPLLWLDVSVSLPAICTAPV